MDRMENDRLRRSLWLRRGSSRAAIVCAVGLLAAAWPAYEAFASQPAVGLGTAQSFAVLGATAVTNTGSSTLNGDLGVSPGTSVTGFPPGTVNGATHETDAVAMQAQSDLTTAYNDAAGRTPAVTESGDLGGQTLTPGVYKSASSLGLTGVVTLNGEGNKNAVFVFQAGSSLTTASSSTVKLINGARACDVYWQVGSSATLGSSSVFVGNVLAYTSISIKHGVTLEGRALASNGAVTLIDDTITPSSCATKTGSGPSGGDNGTSFFTTTPPTVAKQVGDYGTRRCVRDKFGVAVKGLFISHVVFSMNGTVFARRGRPPFTASVRSGGGIRRLDAHVFYKDHTPAADLRFRYRACATSVKRGHPKPPRHGGGFTG